MWSRFLGRGARPAPVAPPSVDLVECIGRGAYGEVWRGTRRGATDAEQTTTVAVKCIERRRLAASADAAQLLRTECAVWARVRHECLMPLLEIIERPTQIWLVTELMEESLSHVHARMRRLDSHPRLRTILNGLAQVAQGMAFLHAQSPPIVHRDLKSDNVLLRHGAAEWRVADFGLARFVDGGPMTAETGTYRWMAPEVVRHAPYGLPCDVYSFGMLFYECLTLEVPFAGLSPVEAAFAATKHHRRPVLPSNVDARVVALVEAAWHEAPSARPTFAALLDVLDELGRDAQSRNNSFDGASSSPAASRPAANAERRTHRRAHSCPS